MNYTVLGCMVAIYHSIHAHCTMVMTF